MVFEALRAAGSDPAANLALEEAFLSLPADRAPLLLLYVNDPCVIVGRNQNPWAEVSPRAGLPVLRRVSGGGAVYHDRGNLNWALIVPRNWHDPGAELELIAGVLRGLGIEVDAGARGGLYVRGPSVFAAGKLSGTARRFGAHRVLHHGTILVDADLGRLRSCLGGLCLRSSRAIASVPARPVNASSLRPGLGVEDLAGALVAALAGGARVGIAETALRALGAEGVAQEARLRHQSWNWTWGETPAFSVAAPRGREELVVEVSRGRVVRVDGPGAESLGRALGSRFDYDLPSSFARADV